MIKAALLTIATQTSFGLGASRLIANIDSARPAKGEKNQTKKQTSENDSLNAAMAPVRTRISPMLLHAASAALQSAIFFRVRVITCTRADGAGAVEVDGADVTADCRGGVVAAVDFSVGTFGGAGLGAAEAFEGTGGVGGAIDGGIGGGGACGTARPCPCDPRGGAGRAPGGTGTSTPGAKTDAGNGRFGVVLV